MLRAIGLGILLSFHGTGASAAPAAESATGAAESPAGIEAPLSPAPTPGGRPAAIAPGSATPGMTPGTTPGTMKAHATLHFRNDAGDSYELTEARFVMDGETLPTVVTENARGKDFVIFTGPVRSGGHVITSYLTYQGRAHGVFTYTKGYTFNVESQDSFVTPGDRAVSLTIIGKEKKGINIPLEKRLTVTVEDRGAAAAGDTPARPASTGAPVR
jgi:hypothetical protein